MVTFTITFRSDDHSDFYYSFVDWIAAGHRAGLLDVDPEGRVTGVKKKMAADNAQRPEAANPTTDDSSIRSELLVTEPITRVEQNGDWLRIDWLENSIYLTIEQAKYLQRQLETVLGVPFEGAVAKQERNTAGVGGRRRK